MVVGDGLGLLLAAMMGSAVDERYPAAHQDAAVVQQYADSSSGDDYYEPRGVHIWETELNDFVVLYVVKGNGVGGDRGLGHGEWDCRGQ